MAEPGQLLHRLRIPKALPMHKIVIMNVGHFSPYRKLIPLDVPTWVSWDRRHYVYDGEDKTAGILVGHGITVGVYIDEPTADSAEFYRHLRQTIEINRRRRKPMAELPSGDLWGFGSWIGENLPERDGTVVKMWSPIGVLDCQVSWSGNAQHGPHETKIVIACIAKSLETLAKHRSEPRHTHQ